MKPKALVVLLWGREAGRLTCDVHGRLSFSYADAWRDLDEAVPLSLSMPLGGGPYGHRLVENHLWGLLPENEETLRRWGAEFQVSARSAFALLAHTGEECPGAVQFVREERLAACLSSGRDEVTWLSPKEVASRIRDLRETGGTGRRPGDTGQFSLAGAQPKTALLLRNGRWGIPRGRTPTTHILKPPLADYAGHVENEHLCLELARSVGLPAAASEVRRFGDEIAIVVARYDRIARPGPAGRSGVLRLHQEDVCQALGLPPAKKYQSAGGPSPRDVANLLRAHSSEPTRDVETFVDALAFQWLIGGTDAHAKNYSLLLAPRGQVRLAPLYDLSSALPYPDLDPSRLRLAMRVGRQYPLLRVGRAEWRALIADLGLPIPATLDRIAALVTRFAVEVAPAIAHMRAAGLRGGILSRLTECLLQRTKLCLDALSP